MLFHTNDIELPISLSAYNGIRANLAMAARAASSNSQRTGGDGGSYTWHEYDWHNYGIKAAIHKKKGNATLLVTYNCSKLLKENERIELPKPNANITPQLKQALVEALKKTGLLHGVALDTSRQCSCEEDYLVTYGNHVRIDCCVNWRIKESQKELYASVLNRGYRPSYQLPPRAQGKPFKSSASFATYHTDGNGFTYLNIGYNLYDKQNQLNGILENGNYPPTAEELERSKNIFRLEIQVGRYNLINSKKNRSFDNLITPSNSRYYIQTYLAELVWSTGDYVRYDDAVHIIKTQVKNAEQKRTMLKIVDALSNESVKGCNVSLDMVLNDLKFTKNKRNRYKQYFDNLGINPVTIPNRCEYKRLDSPLKYMDKLFAEVKIAETKATIQTRKSVRPTIQQSASVTESTELSTLKSKIFELRYRNLQLEAQLDLYRRKAQNSF